MRLAITIFCVIIAVLPCAAQEITPGSTVQLMTDLPLRTEPPGGLFGLKGDRLGEASRNARYKVIETKSITAIGGGQQWLMVQDINNPSKKGWVYFGPKGSTVGNAVLIAR